MTALGGVAMVGEGGNIAVVILSVAKNLIFKRNIKTMEWKRWVGNVWVAQLRNDTKVVPYKSGDGE